MSDHLSSPSARSEESRGDQSPNMERALRVASSISVIVTVWVPASLALLGLIIGLAAASIPIILIAVILGILAAYGWVQRVRVNG